MFQPQYICDIDICPIKDGADPACQRTLVHGRTERTTRLLQPDNQAQITGLERLYVNGLPAMNKQRLNRLRRLSRFHIRNQHHELILTCLDCSNSHRQIDVEVFTGHVGNIFD